MLSIIERMMALFAGHEGAHGTHGVPEQDADGVKWGIKRTADTIREPATPELWAAHLKGEKPLGIIPIRADSTCYWGSIDVDEYVENLLGLISNLERLKLPLLPCRSKSGGLHLFIFLSDPVPAARLQLKLKNIAALLGQAKAEIFPKQTQVLTERGDVGNWIIAPYFGSTYDGKIKEQVGLKKTGAEMTIEEFIRTAERIRLTPEAFEALNLSPPVPVKRSRGAKSANGSAHPPEGAPFADGPPCLQHLISAPLADGRKRTLFMMGVYLKRSDNGDWASELENYNLRYMQPPLNSDEVQSVKRSLNKKDYNYTCKSEPMVSFCNSALCMTRKFGVGEEGRYPTISGLSKLNTDPPMWFADVEDQRLECSTDELQNYMKFHKLCMDKVNRCYGTMKQETWLTLVSEAMRNVTLIEAPPDVGTSGRFLEYLEEFLTNRATGERVEDLFRGVPWECIEESRYYFRLQDFQKFLNREGVKDEREYSRGKLTQKIKSLGGSNHFFNVKGKGVYVWWVPSGAVNSVPRLETPKMKRDVI